MQLDIKIILYHTASCVWDEPYTSCFFTNYFYIWEFCSNVKHIQTSVEIWLSFWLCLKFLTFPASTHPEMHFLLDLETKHYLSLGLCRFGFLWGKPHTNAIYNHEKISFEGLPRDILVCPAVPAQYQPVLGYADALPLKCLFKLFYPQILGDGGCTTFSGRSVSVQCSTSGVCWGEVVFLVSDPTVLSNFQKLLLTRYINCSWYLPDS